MSGGGQTFFDHISELRSRLLISLSAVILGGFLGYFFRSRLLLFLEKPLGKPLYYNSPSGGFLFIFKVCIFFGFLVALPIIFYQIIKFIIPAFEKRIKNMPMYILLAVILAFLGSYFSYAIVLPASLNFLTNFDDGGLNALIDANNYLNFIGVFILSFAIIFQLPLVMLIINKIKTLSPKKLLRYLKHIVVISFVVSAIITPTPDPFNQTLIAGPIILLYLVSIVLIYFYNKRYNVIINEGG